MRFGLTSGPLELDEREMAIIANALRNQWVYSKRLAEKNKDEEARGRNLVNALEIKILIDKVKGAASHE